MELWDIYDANGKNLNKKVRRGNFIPLGEYHLVVHIWLYNNKNEFLIQKRNKPLGNKPLDSYKNIWACTGGAVLAGETSLDAAIRETKEEMGINLNKNKLIKIDRTLCDSYIQDVWIGEWNGNSDNIKFDPVEVQEVSWVTEKKLNEMIRAGQFYNYSEKYFSNIIAHSFI